MKNKRKNAFTLIEIVVVISIMALLMTVLMPALAMAQQYGKSIFCLNNLRQMAIAATAYANNYDSFFPLARMREFNCNDSGDWEEIRHAWDFSKKKGSTEPLPGLLWQEDMIDDIQQCPSFKGAANWDGDPFTGYNYNSSYIGGDAWVRNGTAIPGTVARSAKIDKVRKPSECAIFGDGEFSTGANKFMRSPNPGRIDLITPPVPPSTGTQGYRHMDKTNVAYCDGSARSVRDCFKSGKDAGNIAEGTGFLSEDNGAYDPN